MDMVIDPPPTGAAANGDTSSVPAAANSVERLQKKMHLTETKKLEHQLLRVPVEQLKKTIRSSHRSVEKELSSVISGVSSAADLTSLVSRLHGIKRKVGEGSRAEAVQVQRCRARIDHLADPDSGQWNAARLNRFLVDYMLRMSYYDPASLLANFTDIQELVDIDVFMEARQVVESLQNKKVGPALAWCAENKSRLKKSKSKLEFVLRLQEFIEMIKGKEYLRAIAYARKYLAPWGPTHMRELQRVTATLAFKSGTGLGPYKALFDPERWDLLVDQFKQEFARFFGITLQPLLLIYLQAGLSALKTPFCPQGNCPKEDPLSQAGFRKLAEPLPFSKQHHSKLVCYITKELMDTENPPLVLPNGYVYSTKALEEMAKNNGGKITCPRTGETCNFSELVKAYIS
ncbi:hypothetical protein LUZ60_004114 [Juncus effusus]|nr:hypothetical protein LUZ60_004114 [Juncus effusus]